MPENRRFAHDLEQQLKVLTDLAADHKSVVAAAAEGLDLAAQRDAVEREVVRRDVALAETLASRTELPVSRATTERAPARRTWLPESAGRVTPRSYGSPASLDNMRREAAAYDQAHQDMVREARRPLTRAEKRAKRKAKEAARK